MYYEFPSQNVSESVKNTKKWHMKHAYAFFNHTTTSHYSERIKEISELSYAIVGKVSPRQKTIIEKTLTQQYGEDFQIPYQVYPLIEQKLEEAIGHYRLRPLRSKTSVINRTAVSTKLQEIIDRVAEAVERDVNSTIEQEAGVELGSTNPDMEVPEMDKIDEFIGTYRTENEKLGELVLDYLLNAKGEKEKIYAAAMFYLGFGDTAFFIDEKNGNPTLYVPHPSEYYSDMVPTEDIQDDAEIVALDQWFSQNEILNKFDLNEKERKQLDKLFKDGETNINLDGDLQFSRDTFVRKMNGMQRCRVVSLYWKSRRKLEFNEYVNSTTGEKEARKIGEDISEKDKKRIIDKDQLEVIEVENIRHITMIGPELVLSWGSLKDQISSVGDPRKRFIPFVRIVSDNVLRTGEVRCMAKKLKFLQDLASEVLWEIKFNLRQMDGNVLVYDTSMFPKELFGDIGKTSSSAGKALDKVVRLLKKDRIMVINSKDKRSNHYASSVSVSQKGRIQDLLQMFALIESVADKISGIPSQNANQVYQKATVAELQAQNTSTRLEEYFGPFETAVERALNYLIAKGQQLYKKNDILSYVGGDKAQKFVMITEDFANDDLGIKFVNNRKDYESKSLLDQMATRMMSTTDKFEIMIAMLDVFDSENYEEAKEILIKNQKHLEEMQKAANEAMQQQEQARLEAEQAKITNENEQKQLDREKDIEVAKIYANNKADSDRIKEDNANLRKAAELEQKERERQTKEKESESKKTQNPKS